jgi:uncharacterized protein (TIGR03083 family)
MSAPDYRMSEPEVWDAIATERSTLLHLLEELPESDWSRPSLCSGWQVRDVAAHVALAPASRPLPVLLDLLRAGGDFDRMVDVTARRAGARSREQILHGLRTAVRSRRLAPGTSPRVALLDALVHTQDVTLPLGIDHPVPTVPGREAAERVWAVSFPFRARRRLAGFRLTATDISWQRGDGPPVTGPIGAVLLLLTGRPAALARLSGSGVAHVTAALPPLPQEGPS